MKKNICALLYSLLLVKLSSGQDQQIVFSIENSKVTATLTHNYSLPFELVFSKDFNGKEIKFVRFSNDSGFFAKGKFGRDNEIQFFQGTDSFQIKVGKDRALSFKMGSDNPKINFDTFFVKIGSDVLGPIMIATSKMNEIKKDKYSPGYLFYDALKLKELYADYKRQGTDKVSIKDSIKYILNFYGITDRESLTKNAYLDPVFNSIFSGGELNSLSLPGSSFISSVGGLDVTKYANAIADIMIERAKQELTVAFFNRFKKFAEKNPEFQILFPKTTENLNNLLTYTYPQMLPALRNGFFQDIKQITYHLDDVLNLPRYQKLLENFPEARISIRSLRLVHELETGASNAADIINEFAGLKEWTDDTSPIKIKSVGSCLKISALLSESIRNDTTQSHTDNVWVPAKELKKVFYDSILFKIYMGLLYQKAVNDKIQYVDFTGYEKNFSDILKAHQNNLFLFQNKLKEFFDLTGNVNVAFKDLQNKIERKENPNNDDIYNYINVSLDAVEYSFSIVKIFKETPVADNYLALARKSNSLFRSIYSKEYTQAVHDALDILTLVDTLINNNNIDVVSIRNSDAVKTYVKTADADIKKIVEGGGFLSQVKDKVVLEASMQDIINPEVEKLIVYYNLKRILDFIEKLKPYALFMANMVEAKTEGEVKAALENVILPVGSSSIKKNTLGNVSVQTYLGAFLSVTNNSSSSNGTWADKFGVTGPIGISWTPSIFSWQKYGSLSLFGSLFDLGAIVDYKLKKDSATGPVSKEYKVKLGQLFSPGVYAVYGFAGNVPLAFGFGAQYGPGLSKVETTANTVIGNPSVRWNLFFAVDMPFFTLKNKNKITTIQNKN
jgi:hypothetical protein